MTTGDRTSLKAALGQWPARRWAAAAGAAVLTYLVIAIPTDLINTPLFIREIPPTWWAVPALVVTSMLSGLLVATYIAPPPYSKRVHDSIVNDGDNHDDGGEANPDTKDKSRFGIAGTITAFFAVGCPVCNKLVLLALGSTGAVQYFEPLQPLLAMLSIGLLAWAFVRRTISEDRCPAPAR